VDSPHVRPHLGKDKDGTPEHSGSDESRVTSEETLANKTNTPNTEGTLAAEPKTSAEGSSHDQFDRAGRELLSAVPAEASSALEESLPTIARIPRTVLLTEAWTRRSKIYLIQK